MAITVADNFSYQGKKPLDGRDTFPTLAAMKAYAEASVYDGCLSYCDEDGKRYEFKSTNTVDPTTGKWREYSSGGGGETYNDFTGATASTAGAHGLVPAPSAGDEDKVLFGNGLWGALPSVDLSVLSNEAFIFSETEKPVGMWTDRKILYAKTIENTFSAQQTEDWHTVGNLGTDADAKFVFGHFTNLGVNHIWNVNSPRGEVSTLVNLNTTGQVSIRTPSMNESSLASITAFYTKTTDSPLASDVKFAGVDENGNVIYKKTFTGTWSATTTAETKTFPFASTLKLRKTEGVYHTQYGDWSINTLNYNVSNNRLDYGVVAYTDPSNNTLVVERKGFYLSPLSGRSFEVDVYYTTTS
jgi:hypothetical protein